MGTDRAACGARLRARQHATAGGQPRGATVGTAGHLTRRDASDWAHDGAILLGHSLGGTILIHTLAENPPEREFGAIILIAAPFVGEGGWRSDDWKPQRELGRKLPGGVPIYLYHGLADDIAPPSHVELYAHAIPQAHLCRMAGRDHQFNNDLTDIAAVIESLPAEA